MGKYGTEERISTIKKGESVNFAFESVGYYPGPLVSFDRTILKDSTIVIFQNRQLIFRYWLNDPLYRSDNYKVVKSEKLHRWYEWTFTDEDFVAAEEIK